MRSYGKKTSLEASEWGMKFAQNLMTQLNKKMYLTKLILLDLFSGNFFFFGGGCVCVLLKNHNSTDSTFWNLELPELSKSTF